MSQGLRASVLVVCIGLTLWPIRSKAQTQPDVEYLTNQEVTSEKLIKNLKKTRAVKLIAEPCEKAQRRGIALQGVSKTVALNILFAYNSAALVPESLQTLNKLGEALKSDELGLYRFQIAGHTDSRGSDIYNCKLSRQRAESVMRYLAKHFRIEQKRLLPVGYGEEQPLVDNETEEGRQKNRRVEIVNLGQPSSD